MPIRADRGHSVTYTPDDLLDAKLLDIKQSDGPEPADRMETQGKGLIEFNGRGELRWSAARDAMGSKELSTASLASLHAAATIAIGESGLSVERELTLQRLLEAAAAALPKPEPDDLLG